ncbi:MAG: DUF2520 domain-containing protein [Marinilabiliales bacterium]|nr:DUF2520 domain-containing protein [Marinilabiliales bacterium]
MSGEDRGRDCLFCRIVRRELPAKVVYEDERLFAFEDIHPKAPVHVLDHPQAALRFARRRSPRARPALLGEILLRARTLAAAEGRRRRRATGSSSTPAPTRARSVFHIHFHVLGGRTLQLAARACDMAYLIDGNNLLGRIAPHELRERARPRRPGRPAAGLPARHPGPHPPRLRRQSRGEPHGRPGQRQVHHPLPRRGPERRRRHPRHDRGPDRPAPVLPRHLRPGPPRAGQEARHRVPHVRHLRPRAQGGDQGGQEAARAREANGSPVLARDRSLGRGLQGPSHDQELLGRRRGAVRDGAGRGAGPAGLDAWRSSSTATCATRAAAAASSGRGRAAAAFDASSRPRRSRRRRRARRGGRPGRGRPWRGSRRRLDGADGRPHERAPSGAASSLRSPGAAPAIASCHPVQSFAAERRPGLGLRRHHLGRRGRPGGRRGLRPDRPGPPRSRPSPRGEGQAPLPRRLQPWPRTPSSPWRRPRPGCWPGPASDREAAEAVLLPLVQGTLQNVKYLGLEKALTGPILRGDVATVGEHLEALGGDPAAREVYRVLGRRLLGLAARSGLPAGRVRALKRRLGGG